MNIIIIMTMNIACIIYIYIYNLDDAARELAPHGAAVAARARVAPGDLDAQKPNHNNNHNNNNNNNNNNNIIIISTSSSSSSSSNV